MTAATTGSRLGSLLRLALFLCAALVVTEAQAATPPATWTTGHKKVLIIPVRFTDQTGPSDVPNAQGYRSGWGEITNGTTAAAINAFFQRSSYGKLSMEFTVLPEINMGVSYTVYNATYGTSGLSKFAAWDEPGSFADDVRAKARQVGIAAGQAALYDSDNYDLDFLFCGFIPGQGTLASGRAHGKGVFGTTSLALAHEFGHNFGLAHANGISRSTFYSPLKGGTFFTDAYGDVFDLMGWKNTAPVPLVPDRDLNPFWKWQMGWLPDANIATPAVSGTYRIHAFDQPTLEAGKNYALRIVRDPSRVYWFSYRASITNEESLWSNNGLEVRIGGESVPSTAGHTTLLDMTPGSRGLANIPGVTNNPYATLYDAPLAIGRTYSDNEANVHVTPVKKGGTAPESLDVVLNYGPFPGNVAPTVSISPATITLAAGVAQTFTATASDPNGDALSYYWEFDDPDALGGTAAGNANPDARLSTQGSHTWTRSGTFLVRCTVSDMKGGKTIASATVTITGGTTALRTISGVVKDENGNPLAGAVVNNYKGGNPNLVRYGATNFVGASETAADGKYVVHVPAGITGTFYLNVLHQGFSFTSSAAGGAVGVYSVSVANVDFTRVRTNRTISGGVYVAGRGYNPATDGTLTVNVNGQNIAATGGGWTTNVADGTPLNITASVGTAGNSVFGTFPNPYVAVDDFNLLHLFLNVAGQMPQVGFPSSGATSDDTVGTVNIPVTLALPPGSNSWPANQFLVYWLDPSGTAEYGVDYKAAGGSINFTGGQVPTPYLIPLKILPTGEPKNKTVVIKLGPASSIVNMGPTTTFTYTITNAPVPPPNAGVIQFAQASYSVAETAGTVTLAATRTGSSSGSASGYYRTANGTATAGQDYTPTTNFVTWLDGDTANKNVVLTILNDAVVESAEAFTVTFFTNTVGATLGAQTVATVTITDDDVAPSAGVIQFAQTAYSVAESAGTVTLVATRSGGSSGSASGYYRTANGTATAGQDYTPTTNFVTWLDGDTANKNVVLTILNDAVVESAETFTVTFFTNTVGATLGAQTVATVTITDDDVPASTDPPLITGQPVAVTTTIGNNVNFAVTATGTPTLGFQWRLNGNPIPSATSPTLALSNVQTNQAGGYSVVITNSFGSVTSSVVALVVNRLAQTITFSALPAKQTTDAPFVLTATASSGQPVSYASSDPAVATVSGSTVTLVGAGTTTITASQPGNATYLAAANVTQTLTVTAAPPAGGTIYNVGPGQPLAALRDVPWGTLQPGAIVNIHSKPGGYKEKIQISASGTANARIVIRGIPDPVTGALPIIDGKDAVEDPSIDFRSPVFSDLGIIVVSPRKTGYVYGVYHVSFVDIETLDIRNALYTADNSITYTDQTGAVRGYHTFGCGIYIEWAHDLTIRGCEISYCGNGLFANSKNLAAQSSARLLIERNYFHDNSHPYIPDPNNPGSPLQGSNGYHHHHCYTESVGAIYQYNRFGRLRPGAHGVAIKDRSSGQIIRYNEFDMTEQSNVLNLADAQGGSGHIDVQPDYRDSYVYGNLITIQPYASSISMVFWGAFNGPNFYAAQHRGTLHFYHNTIVNHHENVALFLMPDRTYTGTNRTYETVECRNNIFFTDTALQNNIYDAMYFTTGGSNSLGGGDVVLGKNWISPNWRKESPNHPSTSQLLGTANLIVGDVNGANNPGFADMANRDYRLLSGANSLDAAGPLAPAALPANDVTQQFAAPQTFAARVTLGAAPDLGAVESTGAAPPPGPGQLQFASANYSVNEAAGSVTLTVLRVNGTNGAVGVSFATASGTATSPADFTAINGTLAWPAGDATPKTLAVTLVNDTVTESSKGFTVSLSNPTGTATFGSPTTATVTLFDDDAPPVSTVPNRRPQSQPQCLLVVLNTATPITLAGRDGDGDPLTYSITVAPTRGVLSGTAPNLTYTPNNNVSGPDYFCFVANDGKTDSHPAVVTLAINSSANPPPVVGLLTPATNSWFVGPTNIVLTASATDTDGIYAVEFYEGTNALAQLFTPPFTFTWTNPPPGTYTLLAKAYDAGGRRGLSAPATIRVLGAMPVVNVRPTGGMFQVAWPLGVSGAVLEESTNLRQWTLVTNAVVDTVTERTHSFTPGPGRYFRFSVW